MPWETWTLYVATVLVLMSTPGPSQLLMLSNSVANGFPRALFTAWGDLTANLLQMLAAGLGLAAILLAVENALTIVKWLGVAYLAWLGIKMIRHADVSTQSSGAATGSTLPALWLQGFLTSAANPKAVVFFAALFPQFIQASHAFWPQFAILSATYLVLDALFLSLYGATAARLAARLKGQARTWLNRIGGSLMLVAAILLGLKTIGDAPSAEGLR